MYGKDVNLAKFNEKSKKKDMYNKLGKQITDPATGEVTGYTPVKCKPAEYDS